MWYLNACVGSVGGFQTIALVGFISPLAVMALGPWCGQLLDLTPRRTSLRFIAVTQTAAIVTAGKPKPSAACTLSCGFQGAVLLEQNCKAVMAIIRKDYLSLHSSRPEGHDAGCRNGDGARIAPGTKSELAAQHLVSGSARVHNGGEAVSLCVGHCHRERLDAPGATLQASLRLTGLTSSWTEPCCKL